MKKGFTLAELTVVIGILSIIVLIIAQPVTNIITYQRESQQSDNVRDNVQFILNVIDKELRTSSNLASSTSSEISFTDQENTAVKYSLSPDNIIKKKVGLSENNYSDPSVFTVENLTFTLNKTGENSVIVVTTSITAKSIDGKDIVTMQSTTMPRNN